MIALMIALGLCIATIYTLKGGLVGHQQAMTIAGFDLQSLGLGVLAVAGAAIFFGPMYGLALILSVMVHEYGHVAAFRIAGHRDARFRLIPLIGGVAISDQLPATQEKDFFITLMGPGICLAPMVTAFILADIVLIYTDMEGVAEFLWVFATTTAALNFFNLLPLWPLDGGRCVRILAATFLPGSVRFVSIAMSAGAAAAAVHLQSISLLFFVLMGTQSLLHSESVSAVQRPMGKPRGVLAGSAYLFTAAAHLAGGWTLVTAIF